MHLGPTNILKDMRKHKPIHCKPKKLNSIEKAKKKKKDLLRKNKNLYV
jgi:hypothetical protein